MWRSASASFLPPGPFSWTWAARRRPTRMTTGTAASAIRSQATGWTRRTSRWPRSRPRRAERAPRCTSTSAFRRRAPEAGRGYLARVEALVRGPLPQTKFFGRWLGLNLCPLLSWEHEFTKSGCSLLNFLSIRKMLMLHWLKLHLKAMHESNKRVE